MSERYSVQEIFRRKYRKSLFEFQDYDDEIINYSLWITFDENGFVINVSDIDAQGYEGEDCRQSYTDGCAPDYGFLESEIRRELAEDQ